MIQSTPRTILEAMIELFAASALGGAVAFAAAQGVGLVPAVVLGTLTAGVAATLLARIDRSGGRAAERFMVVDFPGDEEMAQGDDVLLLDDPLPALDAESRVVRLFAVNPGAAADPAAPIAAPGEMVARIADFLGTGRSTGSAEPQRGTAAAADDATAALHAALADIRRSLRHG